MNTQNVNVNTATPESPKTWVEGPEIQGLSPALAERLAFLVALSTEQMDEMERAELLDGTIQNMAEQVCNTVTDWLRPRPLLPVSSMTAWLRAGHLALELFGETGEAAWMAGCDELHNLLRAGYAMSVHDFA